MYFRKLIVSKHMCFKNYNGNGLNDKTAFKHHLSTGIESSIFARPFVLPHQNMEKTISA